MTRPNLLEQFSDDLHKCGLTGEDRAAKILYLALTSRIFDRPISIAVKGPSSAGKSHTVGTVLKFFPESAAYTLTAMSQKALAYDTEDLQHRFLVIFEAACIPTGMGTYLIRSLLSEHCIRYKVPQKTPEGMKTVLIEKPGPTGFITTTTLPKLHPENETRLLSINVNDTAEQTQAVMIAVAQAAQVKRVKVDFAPWHALQDWLDECGDETVIPYAVRLAEVIPPRATRLRRDITTLLNLIKAHALLHRGTRERDENGAVVAILADYAAIRDLTADLFAEGVKASVPAIIRETVQTVEDLLPDHQEGVSVATLPEVLELDPGTISRRVSAAEKDGYLINEEKRLGRPARLKLGDPVPDDHEVLPPPEAFM